MTINAAILMIQNDTGPDFLFTIKNRETGEAIALTGATVRFPFRLKDGDGAMLNTGHESCTIVDASAGTCKYVFIAGDLANVGHHEGEVEITFSGGKKQTSRRMVRFFVRGEIG